jgi:carbamoylphosphate synthase large subunit
MYQLPNLETIRGWQSAIPITKLGVNLNHETSRTIKNVIKHLNYSGPCNIDFKLINGIPKIFEINPRLGGSLMVEENLPVLAKILEIVIKNAT